MIVIENLDKTDILAKLNAYSIKKDGHWLFNGYKRVAGYGRLNIDDKINRTIIDTHRLSAWLFHNLDLNSSLLALHKCEFKNCWNPEHIYIGTQAQNIQDSIRINGHKGGIEKLEKCKNGHILSEDNIYKRKFSRICKTCHLIRQKEYYEGKKQK